MIVVIKPTRDLNDLGVERIAYDTLSADYIVTYRGRDLRAAQIPSPAREKLVARLDAWALRQLKRARH